MGYISFSYLFIKSIYLTWKQNWTQDSLKIMSEICIESKWSISTNQLEDIAFMIMHVRSNSIHLEWSLLTILSALFFSLIDIITAVFPSFVSRCWFTDSFNTLYIYITWLRKYWKLTNFKKHWHVYLYKQDTLQGFLWNLAFSYGTYYHKS